MLCKIRHSLRKDKDGKTETHPFQPRCHLLEQSSVSTQTSNTKPDEIFRPQRIKKSREHVFQVATQGQTVERTTIDLSGLLALRALGMN